ncbi:uncharacterized protein LOC103983578 [Musa acuminata AAA Group]|nr:PREDICTED: uncharacterized protein LOC103983578 [Musa acuminata subsp. malaccensis]CAG1837233.1 unnamed protein product [Musa acuminata subsp. malaccensis]
MSKRSGTSNRLGRCMKAPLRALCHARDFYVRSMNSCAGRMEYGLQMGDLPRSYSLHQSTRSSASDEDLRQLIRAASLRRALSQSTVHGTPPPPSAVPRSQSVAIGRIDEDKPCEFGDAKVGADFLLPRSRSYAPGRERNARLFV